MDAPITRGEYEEFAKRMRDEHKRLHYRINDIEKTVDRIQDLAQSVERLAVSMENMAEEQKDQGKRLKTLEGKDGAMWRKVSGYVITTVVGAVVMFILMQIGIR